MIDFFDFEMTAQENPENVYRAIINNGMDAICFMADEQPDDADVVAALRRWKGRAIADGFIGVESMAWLRDYECEE